jgi:hypothetical protein
MLQTGNSVVTDTLDADQFLAEVVYLFHVMHFEISREHSSFALPEEQRLSLSIYGLDKPEAINIQAVLNTARTTVEDHELKKRLCAALKSVSKDVTEISKVVVGVCLPLSLSGHSGIPLNPLLYAGIAMVIFSAGVSALCPEVEIKK